MFKVTVVKSIAIVCFEQTLYERIIACFKDSFEVNPQFLLRLAKLFQNLRLHPSRQFCSTESSCKKHSTSHKRHRFLETFHKP